MAAWSNTTVWCAHFLRARAEEEKPLKRSMSSKGKIQSFSQPDFRAEETRSFPVDFLVIFLCLRDKALRKPAPNAGTCISLVKVLPPGTGQKVVYDFLLLSAHLVRKRKTYKQNAQKIQAQSGETLVCCLSVLLALQLGPTLTPCKISKLTQTKDYTETQAKRER